MLTEQDVEKGGAFTFVMMMLSIMTRKSAWMTKEGSPCSVPAILQSNLLTFSPSRWSPSLVPSFPPPFSSFSYLWRVKFGSSVATLIQFPQFLCQQPSFLHLWLLFGFFSTHHYSRIIQWILFDIWGNLHPIYHLSSGASCSKSNGHLNRRRERLVSKEYFGEWDPCWWASAWLVCRTRLVETHFWKPFVVLWMADFVG